MSLNLDEFQYDYITGQWSDQGNYGGWATLGYAGLSASFMGDGGQHNLGGWDNYIFSGSYGYWQGPSGIVNYHYNYISGHWYEQVWGYPLVSLGDAGQSALFGHLE